MYGFAFLAAILPQERTPASLSVPLTLHGVSSGEHIPRRSGRAVIRRPIRSQIHRVRSMQTDLLQLPPLVVGRGSAEPSEPTVTLPIPGWWSGRGCEAARRMYTEDRRREEFTQYPPGCESVEGERENSLLLAAPGPVHASVEI
ncbi:hypothetical protein BV20DRAFT_524653 [Pilatotrama ljubarskyi]|nr:hypothetical protein BV20DRAFT_524653 [Pilatotrama ljubarskyi]